MPGLKGKILALSAQGTNFVAKQDFELRINSIVMFNLSAVTINVKADEEGIDAVPIPASTSLSLDPFDLYGTNVLRLEFTATASASINLIWTEGPSFFVIAQGRR